MRLGTFSGAMAAMHSPKILLSDSIIKSHTLPPSPTSGQQKSPLKQSIFPDKESPLSLSSLCVNKRTLTLSFLSSAAAALFFGVLPNIDKSIAQEQQELERYTDSMEGFTLFRPSSWIQVDKAGATVLFEEADKGTNNLGVVVSPVRLASLGQFGSPEFVADKLIQAEKRKESTKDAEVIKVAERSGKDGLQVYEFEYKLDSTRGGMKRIFSAAFVTSKKLYLLNIAHSDKPESPLDRHTRTILEQVLHSFDATPST